MNNETGGAGLFAENQLTDEGNSPSDDLMCIKVSAGTAYVKGYDVDLVGSTIIDVPKPRTTKSIAETRVPFAMGSLLKLITLLVFHIFLLEHKQDKIHLIM